MLNFVSNFHFLMTLFVGKLNSYNLMQKVHICYEYMYTDYILISDDIHLQHILTFVSGSMHRTLSVWEYYIAYQSQHLTCDLHSKIYSRLTYTSLYQGSEDIFQFQIYFYIYDSDPAWVGFEYHCAILVRNYP